MKYRFDKFLLDTGARELSAAGEVIPLEPRTYELLAYLLERRDDAVGKDELQNEVWGTIVSESTVARSVMKLRKALGDGNESIIKTVPRFGYRFNAVVYPDDTEAEARIVDPSADGGRRLVPVAILVVLLAAGALATGLLRLHSDSRQQAAEPVSSKSVAVLPFDDMSETGGQEWFADGLAEELLNALARAPDLLVASRTSSFAYRDTAVDIREIASRLGVANVVEGSVRRDDKRMRVTAQLVRASDGFHLWSETYDRSLDDLIDTQEQIALDIANALETAMDPQLLQQMLSTGTRSVAAFEAYMQGLSDHAAMVATGDTGGYHASIAAFERAVELDSNYSAAHQEIAEYWSTQLSLIGIAAGTLPVPREAARRNFHDAIARAIATTDDSARQLTLRSNQAYLGVDLLRAYELNTAYLERRPNDWAAQSRQISLLINLGRHDELVATTRRFVEIGVHNSVVLARALHAALYTGDVDAIQEFLDIVLKRAADSAVANYQVHRSLLWLGRPDDAKAMLKRVLASRLPTENKYLARLRQACAESDDALATQLVRTHMPTFSDDVAMVWLTYKLLGDETAAVESIRHFDNADITAYGGFLDYGNFDAAAYPNLRAHLETYGEPRPQPREIPFRCKIGEIRW